MANRAMCSQPRSQPTLYLIAPAEWTVLDLLLNREGEHPYTAWEIAQVIGSAYLTFQALDTLTRAGLISRSANLIRLT